MAYGDYDGPDKEDKGQEGGSCNRTRCQAPGAVWYNHGSMSWYCPSCRRDIQFDSFNLRGWQQDHEPKCGHPMFETRHMMDARMLKERLTEIEGWHNTGILEGRALRTYAREKFGHIPVDEGERLSMAERETHREAARAIISGAYTPAEEEDA